MDLKSIKREHGYAEDDPCQCSKCWLIAEVERLEGVVKTAIEEIEDLIPYKSDYLVAKHRNQEALAEIKKAIKAGA